MKKVITKIVFLFILVVIFFPTNLKATDEIISSQMESLDMQSFIEESQGYTEEAFPDVEISESMDSIIKGEFDNSTILKQILSLFGDEIVVGINLFSSILVIIIVQAILKGVTDHFNNDNISKIAYFIEYILIVTLIMKNFSEIITMIKDTISNLTGLMNSLVPMLLALMMATGNTISANLIQPIIIFIIIFIRKFYNNGNIASNSCCNSNKYNF